MIHCHGCKQSFQPKMRLQWYCEPCRSQSVHTSGPTNIVKKQREEDLQLKPGFISRLCKQNESMERLSERLNLDKNPSTLSNWNCTGRIPNKYGAAERFCEALGLTREEVKKRYGR